MRIRYKGRVYKLREGRKALYMGLALLAIVLIASSMEYLEYLQ